MDGDSTGLCCCRVRVTRSLVGGRVESQGYTSVFMFLNKLSPTIATCGGDACPDSDEGRHSVWKWERDVTP